MLKKHARALVACHDKIEKAIDTCLMVLPQEEREYAESYWAAHIRASIDGYSYGSMPYGKATTALSEY